MSTSIRRPKGVATKNTNTVSRDELRNAFDRKARERLDMSGEEFLRRLDEGTLPDSPAVDEIAILVGED
jgi:hypothetical protein